MPTLTPQTTTRKLKPPPIPNKTNQKYSHPDPLPPLTLHTQEKLQPLHQP